MGIKEYRKIFSGSRNKRVANEIHGKVIQIGTGRYLYESENGTYMLKYGETDKTCTCQDYARHMRLLQNGKYTADGYLCKHLLAIESLCGLSDPEYHRVSSIITNEEINTGVENSYRCDEQEPQTIIFIA